VQYVQLQGIFRAQTPYHVNKRRVMYFAACFFTWIQYSIIFFDEIISIIGFLSPKIESVLK
jgi:hypothetical protein